MFCLFVCFPFSGASISILHSFQLFLSHFSSLVIAATFQIPSPRFSSPFVRFSLLDVLCVKNDINGAITKWSKSCHSRGTALPALLLQPLACDNWVRPLDWVVWTNTVSQTIVCKACRIVDILTTRTDDYGLSIWKTESKTNHLQPRVAQLSSTYRNSYFLSHNYSFPFLMKTPCLHL